MTYTHPFANSADAKPRSARLRLLVIVVLALGIVLPLAGCSPAGEPEPNITTGKKGLGKPPQGTSNMGQPIKD